MNNKHACAPAMFVAFKNVIRKRYERSKYNKQAAIKYVRSYLDKYRLNNGQINEVDNILSILK